MSQIQQLIDKGNELKTSALHEAGMDYLCYSGEEFETWIAKVKLLFEKLSLSKEFKTSVLKECNSFQGYGDRNHMDKVLGFLNAVVDEDLVFAENKEIIPSKNINNKRVFLVHGRNDEIVKSMRNLMTAMGVEVLEWGQCVRLTGSTSPSTHDVITEGFKNAQAIVIIVSPDEEARLRECFGKPDEHDFGFQPRVNVIYEAGLAMGMMPNRTILVFFGKMRKITDIDGISYVEFSKEPGFRADLLNRLELAGVRVDVQGKKAWLDDIDFPEIN